ncbi:glycosyltransferase family 2 protein [Pontibacter sp. SGAir0037]|uniref:glycosyltransferase family 2 protein n=1 Tax=Pontibacter sp. SGAir0037 TaxID=2571030 RepID=UPI001F0EE412|nr:glycosyltransferase family 2 protein [Pontibacter sp. SGAir0037]
MIPIFNERERIGAVLEVISRVKGIAQIVCVDDGSTDGTVAYLNAFWPQVQVVSLAVNQGKSSAIRQGLKAVQHEVVLLMDADLQDLKKEEIQDAVAAFHRYHSIDMIILRRVNAPWFVKFYRSDVLLSGERLIRKKDLEQILSQEVSRYQLEVAINRFMIKNHKVVRWMPWSAMNTYKTEKWGALEGSRKEFRMYVEIVYYVGLVHMFIQLASFTKQLGNSSQGASKYKLKKL